MVEEAHDPSGPRILLSVAVAAGLWLQQNGGEDMGSAEKFGHLLEKN